jgi:chitodextrinase
VKTGKWVQSPYGLAYGTRVYHAPDNATVDAAKIISPSGTVQHIRPTGWGTGNTRGANGNIVTNPNIWYVTNWYLVPGKQRGDEP